MIGGAIIVVLAGSLVIWLAIRMQQERLPRNWIAGVRTPSTMRSEDAFRVANKEAAPLTAAGGVLFIGSGVAAALVPMSAAPFTLLGGVPAAAVLCVAGGIKGVQACR